MTNHEQQAWTLHLYQENVDKITDQEYDILFRFSGLSQKWGYRSGKNEEHIKYEAKTHSQRLILLQKYSDILMHTLHRVGDDDFIRHSKEGKSARKSIFFEHIREKLSCASNLQHNEYQEDISKFVRKFICANRIEFRKLLLEIKHPGRHTPVFMLFIVSVRAFIYIGRGQFFEAYSLFQKFSFMVDKFLG